MAAFCGLGGAGIVLGCPWVGEDDVLAELGAQEDGGVCFIFTGVPMYGEKHEEQ